ncbi:hypothetical protein GQ457_07G004560 [Hibiscus cannabinus]
MSSPAPSFVGPRIPTDETPPDPLEAPSTVSSMQMELNGTIVLTLDDHGVAFVEDDIELLEEDISLGVSVGIPTIDFSDRVQHLAIKIMDLTLVVKVLGRRVGYNMLHNIKFYRRFDSQIGSVVKMDFQTDNGCQGCFARIEVNINLLRPLVSKIILNGRVQIVEYESLPMLCSPEVTSTTYVASVPMANDPKIHVLANPYGP